MKLILLSGGSGKRLWPLSNDSRSKQFIKVLSKNSNEMESMVQRVWKQLDSVGLASSSYIATSKSQSELIQSQLGEDVPVIIEPSRRDTFPAIALASTYLYSHVGIGLNEVVAVLPVDPFVEDSFFNEVKELEKILLHSKADIALIGVKPTYPSEKYGYIVPEDQTRSSATYLTVKRFAEKPDQAGAKRLIEQNAFWNCGVFAFRLGFLISLLESKRLPVQYEELTKQYGLLDKISFDYEVVEKCEKIVMLPYSGCWKDLGTWNTLTEEMKSRQIGKGSISNDSTNTHLVNELDIPVTIIGMTNAIIAASPDGILVADKQASPRIKDFIKDTLPIRYEERLWGWYRVLDYTKTGEGSEVLTKRICISANSNISYHFHRLRKETWNVISGRGLVKLENNIVSVSAGDVIQIPAGLKHAIKALTDLEIIEIQNGQLLEEDIHRLQRSWEEIADQSIVN
ncbi:sugar phosphate nucleotidyltransferase [Paenibacillus sp. CC-CFT747]|nr:sugar phosphate nucleotidyltransferase [Paenibacillus sp. CC-CFT747]